MLVQVPPLSPAPYQSPPKWDIARIHLVPATHAPNLSPIATMHKKSIFISLYSPLIDISVKWRTFGTDGVRTKSDISMTSLEHIP